MVGNSHVSFDWIVGRFSRGLDTSLREALGKTAIGLPRNGAGASDIRKFSRRPLGSTLNTGQTAA